jgi:endoglucanase
MIDMNLLERLTQAHGTAGDEGEIRQLIRTAAAPYGDSVTEDALGNLIVNKKGTGKKIMLAAHMDGVGFMVTHYEKEGVLRFAPVGGLDPASILQAPVRFPNNVYGVISCDDNKLGKELKMTDLFLDIGAKDEDEARKLVQIGDTAVYATPFLKTGNRVMAPYLDNRAGCLVLLEAIKQMKNTENDLSFVFTTQEEVGTRGAQPAAYALEPDYALVVDVTCPDDIPGALHEGTTAVGKGAAIKIMDHSVISSPSVVQKLNQLAQEKNISAQNDVLTCGGTDGGPIHRSRSGVLTGGVSIPCRYTHAPVELIDLNDLEECVRLVCAFCESEL